MLNPTHFSFDQDTTHHADSHVMGIFMNENICHSLIVKWFVTFSLYSVSI